MSCYYMLGNAFIEFENRDSDIKYKHYYRYLVPCGLNLQIRYI